MKHFIAFDVSMGKSYMVIYNALKHSVFEGEINHYRTEFEELKKKIDDLTEGYGEQPEIVFEATGVYSKVLERFMNENYYTYSLLNPLEAKLQCNSLRIHKTDKSGAHRLALTHFTIERRKKEGSNDLLQQLKSLSRYYSELEKIFTSKSELFLNMVQLFPHPEFLQGLSKTVIKNKVRKNTNKNISLAVAERKALDLFEVAKHSFPAVSSTDVLCEQIRSYARRYQELLREKEQCIKNMIPLAESRKEYKIILSFPGIGPNTAVRLIAEIGDIHRFDNPKQLNAFPEFLAIRSKGEKRVFPN